ncbi:MAG: hypothetical protein IKB86_03280 [Clostridia bacterium]|nr:hypothetical protein [Clostridia bacterium]MBR6633302.1 hypothetical protein [Clostridia bacterium]
MASATQYTERYIPVLNDTMSILLRLKEIDESYFILLNRQTDKFEIHSSAQGEDTFCLELPFSFLDARTLNYARKYRRERAKQIYEEMERENERLEKRQAQERFDEFCLAIENSKGGAK